MKDILIFGFGLWVGLQLAKSQPIQTGTPPPPPDVTGGNGQPISYFPSGLLGAKPVQPFQVRWGTGIVRADTTRKAQMVL